MVSFTRQPARTTHKKADTAKLTGSHGDSSLAGNRLQIRVQLELARNEKIDQAVTIIVAPRGSGRPTAQSDASLFRYVSKGAVVVVVIQAILAVVGDVNVQPAVIVIVSDGDAKTPPLVGITGFVGYVTKSPVPMLVKQHCGRGSYI